MTPPSTLLCAPADFDLGEDGTVRAPVVGDVYFSAEDGLAEARAVFLGGAGLPERWRGRRRFTVAELGLGTGLSLVALLDLWRRHRPAGGRLDIVSVEGQPLSVEQASSALRRWPELSPLARALLSVWPPPWKGTHRRRIDALGVTLTFLQDDVEAALEQADFRADAWFLDGFAPARNPSMWSAGVLGHVARLSAPGARAATFTVASVVRQRLAEVGFAVRKCPGFGGKRERLEATLERPQGFADPGRAPRWAPSEGAVLIVGGGIAAASLVHALNARGRAVKVIAEGGWARGASSAPAGLLTPRLEAADRPHVRALMAAFAFSRRLLEDRPGVGGGGVLRFSLHEARAERLRRCAAMLGPSFEVLDGGRAERFSGLSGVPPGVLMHPAARLDPVAVVRQLAGPIPAIDAVVAEVRAVGDRWQVLDAAGGVLEEAPNLILAGGARMLALVGSLGLKLRASAGRVFEYDRGPTGPLRAPLAWGGYLSPTPRGVLLGATHRHDEEPGPADEARGALERGLGGVLPALRLGPWRGGWAGVRAVTRDHQPVVGSLAPGLAVLTGLGGRGFAHAPLLAEMLAGDLDGAPAALERAGAEVLHPQRLRGEGPPSRGGR